MLILTILSAILPASLAVKCFTCSWSPKDLQNRTIACSDASFEANVVAISECEHGCQTYRHTDSNGVVEQIRRSCMQSTEEMTGGCKSEETIAFSSKRCTCNYNLCNAVATARTVPIAVQLACLLAAFVALQQRRFL